MRSSTKSIVGESTSVENYVFHWSGESFLELGISYNNNILLPLLNAIIENELENSESLVKNINEILIKLNGFVNLYPEYKQYLLRHTDYNLGLQQTYLRIYEKAKVIPQMVMFDQMFIDPPPLMFYIQLYKLMKDENPEDSFISRRFSIDQTPRTPHNFNEGFGEQAFHWIEEAQRFRPGNQVANLRDLEDLLLINILQSGDRAFGANLSFVFTLFVGNSGYSNPDEYEFLGKIIYQSIYLGTKRVESGHMHVMDFLNYISKIIESPSDKGINQPNTAGGRIQRKIEEIKTYTKILSLFKPKIVRRYRDKIVEIIYQIFNKLMNPNKSPKAVPQQRSMRFRKVTEDARVLEEIREAKGEFNLSDKGIPTLGIPCSVPNSPSKFGKDDDVSNQGYSQLSFTKTEGKLKEEKDARADLIGLLLSKLSILQTETVKAEEAKGQQPTTYNFDILHVLELIRAKFKENLLINMTPEEVAQTMKSLDFESH